MATVRDTINLVSHGYQTIFPLLSSLGQLLMVLVYQLVVPPALGHPFRLTGLVPLFAYPAILCICVYFRSRITEYYSTETEAKQTELVHCVHSISANFRLIADYSQRSSMIEKWLDVVRTYNKTRREFGKVSTNNRYFMTWLTTLFIAGYMLISGPRVLSGEWSLGMFLADIKVIEIVGKEYGTMYEEVLKVQSVLPALKNIVRILNLPLELKQRMHMERFQVATSELLRTTIDKKAGQPRIDRLPVVVDNLAYSKGRFLETGNGSVTGKPLAKLELEQGQLACIVGPKSGGKSTLLGLIGGVHLADARNGGLFVPAHLRVLHISLEPMFIEGSLLHNLKYGVTCAEDGTYQRVLAICRRMGMTAETLTLLESEECLNWNDMLSETQRHAIHIARGLIANPNIICVRKPTSHFDDITAQKVVGLLREFVDQKGVESDPMKISSRRPRTCIATAATTMIMRAANVMYLMDGTHGILRQVDTAEVTSLMLC
eukprot:gnl/TRDRNA2_/TRDRNA2_166713_c3_seq2.p1 gnl/TRDRNA2_/TRDRNA2_166713_c3~~gnl/TRDRNA2_/TRDRNA2_166713_c3_seq2.p1  ORF type:complete len:514 (-),score=54.83 gnl/TRDRNA2_/TRDRNA2_166713_c3_seq2:19-1485(-)